MQNQSPENIKPPEADSPTGRRRKVFFRWMRRLLRLLAVLILVPVIAFQIPWVQSRAAQELTEFLSKEWQTKVSIEKVYLGIFNRVTLDEFYLEDKSGDTLVYAGELDIRHTGLYMLAFHRFNIESLTLRHADVHLSRKKGEEHQNFYFILDYFSKSDKKETKASTPFKLNLRHLYLDDVHFLKPDEVKGEIIDAYVKNAEAHFDLFDLSGRRLELSDVHIGAPSFRISLLEPQPLPAAEKAPVQLTAGKNVPEDTSKTIITIGEFDLEGGMFSLQNLRKQPTKIENGGFNPHHIDVFDIEAHINQFSAVDLEFLGEVEKIAFRDSTGFVVQNLSARQAALSCDGMQLYDLDLTTPYTHLGDTLIFRYDTYYDWEEFEDNIKMEGRFHDSYVALKDIIFFAPMLKNNTFFKENEAQIVQIDGLMKGEVNGLDGKGLKINMADGRLTMEGDFSTRNLAVPDEQFLYLKLNRLHTDVSTLRKLIPGFRPPDNFMRLGTIDFSGKFNGFFEDFVADGQMRTDIGSANMFMNLKLRGGREKAEYLGDLYLKNFDLGKWSGNPEFGKITFDSHVKEGIGLTLNSANAKLDGKIDSLRFRGYVYKNLTISGELKKNLFSGDAKIEDKNINLTFGGTLDFTDTIPDFDFKADIKQLDIKALNLTTKDLQFAGQVDMRLKGKRLSNIVGNAQVVDFHVVKNGKDTLQIDSAIVGSTMLPSGNKHFTLHSNLGNVDIQGQFDIEKIPQYVTNFLSSYYPKFSERLRIPNDTLFTDTSRFDFTIELFELQNLITFFEEKLSGFDKSSIKGAFDGYTGEMSVEVEVPEWQYQNIVFNDVYFRSRLKQGEGSLQVGVIETIFGENQKLSPVSLIGTIYSDTLEFLVISSNFYNILDNININGVLSLEESDAWRISFRPSDLVLLNQTWEINTANYLRIGEGKVETKNFILSHNDQQIVLKSVRNEGLELQLQNFPLDSLDYIRKIPNHTISGVGDVNFKIKDLFKFQGLSALIRIDDLTINGDNYGTLRLDASAPSLKETVNAFLAIENDSMELTLDGYFNPPAFVEQRGRQYIKKEPLYFDFDLAFSGYPLRIVQYFVSEVANVKGTGSADKVRFYGLPSKPEMEGEVFVKGASFTILPLKTTYRVPEGVVKVTDHLFDGTGNWVYDRFNNKAYLEGGITHDRLRNPGVDLRISTEPGKGFLGLETTEKDNPVFYGTAIGTGYVRFTGSFKQTNLYVNGRTMPGTHMYLPMTGSSAGPSQSRFITFTKEAINNGKEEEEEGKELHGLNMEYDLEITPDALMEVIFDKAWGDVLQGTGSGDLKVIMTRDGRFDMYGDYTVASGNYLFTLMSILNKPFIVEPGGTISWSGDPYNAIIKVSAVYGGLTTSVYNFIQEYISAASADAQDLARSGTPVNLKMLLSGRLLSPNIDFDIDFPSLDSELRNYAENKLRIIRQDPNELNRQVFGLLVLGQFLPSGFTLQAGEVGINTLSEMLSNQLSIYLTEFVSELFTGTNLIQGIDFDFTYNRYSGGDISDPTSYYTSSELEGRLKVIVSDRWSFRVGLSGGNSGYTANSGQLGGEFLIEYVITKDRRLKIKAYSSTEPDLAGGRRSNTGVGLSFRKEFDSLSELVASRKKK
ncbi:MAG: translocation/assembly module TamB domain-containing protein [Lewinellaceae bacterium]|nr:translocation/assembly module TamB domain-containing protein [Saprospiraceae bacterium]MCB9341236.1 translocation/assembly module TamB domain-containing protein [Lewinellaceae bacterium]